MKTITCRRCGYAITWAEQRCQFGRAIAKGLTPDEVKGLMPLCQKCTTEAFHEKAGITRDPNRCRSHRRRSW